MKPNDLRIGELAKQAGVGVETIRFYERKGLIKQPRKTEGFRKYASDDIARIKFIKRAQNLGFKLNEIQDLLKWDRPGRISCSSLDKKLGNKVIEIDQKIEDLVRIKKSLMELQNCCQVEDFSDRECSISECLNN